MQSLILCITLTRMMTSPKRRPGRPATGQKPTRSHRIADELYLPAKEKAAAEGRGVNAVIEELLARWLAEGDQAR